MTDGSDCRRILLLLHGMGATGDVWLPWAPLLEHRWPGRWFAPDLAGHGWSSPLPGYTFAGLADRVAAGLEPVTGAAPGGVGSEGRRSGERLVVLGHSLGGVVALALAARDAGLPVDAVVGLGIKAVWSPAELAKAAELAGRPATWFASRDEAARRYLRVSGLGGLFAPDHPVVDAGLRAEDGRWRLAMDPAAFAVGAPDLPALLASADVPVLLARGEHDPMVSDAQLAAFGVPVVTLPGLGHNAHVEDPAAVLALLDPYL
ncbi:alpha/beta fold hydrolase [Micromonospora sp. DT47]|uniref:alpha/beta fold hydrolase n=1 Tax=Micromonospora sp. DT47 TaxID=3393431 RepID=UPI003CF99FE1